MNNMECKVRNIFLGVILCLSYGTAVFAYEGGEVKGGGNIIGKVILKGDIPEPRAFPLVLYPFGNFCKRISDGEGHVLLKEFNVSLGGGLQDAVVSVQGVEKGKHFRHKENKLMTVNCMFHPADVPENEQFGHHKGQLVHIHPLVDVMRNHRPLSVVNKDPVIHGGQVYQKETGHRVLSFPVPVSSKPYGGVIHLAEGKRIAQIICPMHEYMQTWGWIVDNPYFAKTKQSGEYMIDKLPPGTYKVTAWHPHIKPVEKMVTVTANSTVSIDFEFDASQVVRPIYETQKRFRIKPESTPDKHLEGCDGPFCVKRPHEDHP